MRGRGWQKQQQQQQTGKGARNSFLQKGPADRGLPATALLHNCSRRSCSQVKAKSLDPRLAEHLSGVGPALLALGGHWKGGT
eukprot:9393724-Pyramimonas_sp.AAC.1